MDRKTVRKNEKQEEHTDIRPRIVSPGWPPCKFHSPLPSRLVQTMDFRFGLHSSNLRLRERDTIQFPCSDASIKHSTQQVRIVARGEREREREREKLRLPFLVYLTAKAVFDETVYVSDSEVIELSLFLSFSFSTQEHV